jgi:hypothetical protein
LHQLALVGHAKDELVERTIGGRIVDPLVYVAFGAWARRPAMVVLVKLRMECIGIGSRSLTSHSHPASLHDVGAFSSP